MLQVLELQILAVVVVLVVRLQMAAQAVLALSFLNAISKVNHER
jgi:hypothetical protein